MDKKEGERGRAEMKCRDRMAELNATPNFTRYQKIRQPQPLQCNGGGRLAQIECSLVENRCQSVGGWPATCVQFYQLQGKSRGIYFSQNIIAISNEPWNCDLQL